jgi:hypothetical protein
MYCSSSTYFCCECSAGRGSCLNGNSCSKGNYCDGAGCCQACNSGNATDSACDSCYSNGNPGHGTSCGCTKEPDGGSQYYCN